MVLGAQRHQCHTFVWLPVACYSVQSRKGNHQGSKSGEPCGPQTTLLLCVQCCASAGPPSPPTPAPLPVLYRMGIKATGSSRLAATDYITEPMEPKLKEEIILPPLNSPNPSLSLPSPIPPHHRSPPKVLSAFQISNFVCLCNQKYDGRVSRG